MLQVASFSSFGVKVLAFHPFSLETRVVKSLHLCSCHHVSMFNNIDMLLYSLLIVFLLPLAHTVGITNW